MSFLRVFFAALLLKDVAEKKNKKTSTSSLFAGCLATLLLIHFNLLKDKTAARRLRQTQLMPLARAHTCAHTNKTRRILKSPRCGGNINRRLGDVLNKHLRGIKQGPLFMPDIT